MITEYPEPIAYLVHRLYEYFDIISVFDDGDQYFFWLVKGNNKGRVTLPYSVPRYFDIDDTETEIEVMRQELDEQIKRNDKNTQIA